MKSVSKGIKDFFIKTDKILWLLTFAAVITGFLLINSMQRSSDYNYMSSQIIATVIGLTAAVVIAVVDYEYLVKAWWFLGLVGLGLLILVFFIGINVAGTDDTAWIKLPGGFSFQPSELCKIIFIIVFSKHIQFLKTKEKLHTLFGVLSLTAHVIVPVLLVHLQGDDGTALVFLFIAIIMMFAGGVQLRYFLILLLLTASGIPILWNYVLNDEQKNRFTAVFNIDGNAMTNYGWQQYQGKISIASGGLNGYGLGSGTRVASGIVPEQENDFIFTVAGEELGFVGCCFILLILLLILIKILMNAVSSRDETGRMLCIGVFSLIGVQSIINIGMVLTVMPVIGITLPFFSSGGTSVMSVLFGIGIVQSVYMHKNDIEPNGVLQNKSYKYNISSNY